MTAEELLEQGYQRACALADVPQMMPRKVSLGGRDVLVCRSGEEVFAVDELCPHKLQSMAYGVVHEGKIICPHHQYGFALDTGRCDRRRCAPVQTYPAAVAGEDVYVKLA